MTKISIERMTKIVRLIRRKVCVRQTHLDGCPPEHGADSQPLTPGMGIAVQRRTVFSSVTSDAAATRRSG